jgi:uncharacterized SAM-binding protein YcdF (DUF218 family)
LSVLTFDFCVLSFLLGGCKKIKKCYNCVMITGVIQSFLMPSSFILIFILIGVFFVFKNKEGKLGKIFIITGLFCYYIFSITPVSDYLMMSLEEKYTFLEEEEVGEADKIVVLLGGRESNVLRGSEVLRIWHLANHEVQIIVSGTDPFLSASEDASAVKRFFTNRGVDYDSIIIEGDSHNTRENVINVHKIVGEEPFFLVTSAYHMERSVSEFKRIGADPIPAPTDFKGKSIFRYNFFDFIPHGQNLRNSDLAVHEHLGKIYYRLIFIFNNK